MIKNRTLAKPQREYTTVLLLIALYNILYIEERQRSFYILLHIDCGRDEFLHTMYFAAC